MLRKLIRKDHYKALNDTVFDRPWSWTQNHMGTFPSAQLFYILTRRSASLPITYHDTYTTYTPEPIPRAHKLTNINHRSLHRHAPPTRNVHRGPRPNLLALGRRSGPPPRQLQHPAQMPQFPENARLVQGEI